MNNNEERSAHNNDQAIIIQRNANKLKSGGLLRTHVGNGSV